MLQEFEGELKKEEGKQQSKQQQQQQQPQQSSGGGGGQKGNKQEQQVCRWWRRAGGRGGGGPVCACCWGMCMVWVVWIGAEVVEGSRGPAAVLVLCFGKGQQQQQPWGEVRRLGQGCVGAGDVG
jgi:hypothetical protein